MKSKKKYSGILIGADTNATNEVAKYRSYFGKDGNLAPSSENTNDNGTRLECFVNNNKMCLSSTFFEKNPEDRITWYSNDKRTKKIIDHVIASPAIQKTMSDCGVNNELDFLSDHRCVTANIKTPSSSSPSKKEKYKSYQRRKPSKKDPKRDFSQLDNENVSETYIAEIERILKENERYTSDTTNTPHDKASAIEKRLTKAMEDAATSTLPTIAKDSKCKHEIFRDDATINELIAKRAKATVNDKEKKDLNKQLKKRARELRLEKLQKEANEITIHAVRKDTEKLFKEFFKNNYAFKSAKPTETCDPTKLKEHFEKHFTLPPNPTTPEEIEKVPQYMKHLQEISIDQMKQGPPDELEIKGAIKKLKNGKSSSDVPAEVLKTSSKSPVVMEILLEIFEEIWKTKKTPEDFGNTKMTAIFKNKGEILDPRCTA